MRFCWGLTVGHRYTHDSAPTEIDREAADDMSVDSEHDPHPPVDDPDNETSESGLDSGSDREGSDSESDISDVQEPSDIDD